jgi:hypothetical protein
MTFVGPASRTPIRPKTDASPYFARDESEWAEVTRELMRAHPLSGDDVAAAVLDAWDDIFQSRIGVGQIGVDIFPDPQTMGYLLHELVPLRVSASHGKWRKDRSASEKDLVYTPDDFFSTEIKGSSSPGNQIYGNRSYGVENADPGKKAKSGYYIAINFERWIDAATGTRPKIKLVRFGWLDSTDWRAQASQTGQQSSLPGIVYAKQLPVVFRAP